MSTEPTTASDKRDLIDRIHESAEKFDRDGSSRGDLKLVSRALRELRYALKVFAPYRRKPKVTIFGSARTAPDHPDYQQAVALGAAIAEHGWMVITGAAAGIMQAGHEGAGRENSMGLNILLPFEQFANPVIHGDHKLVHMKYFFTRKLMFVKECSAVVCLPGGFGTLDEALEVLTLLQTGKRDLIPLVLLDAPGGNYWSAMDEFIRAQLLQKGMISPEDLHLYRVTDSIEETVEDLTQFYRVYHSMRYVGDQLVLRVTNTFTPVMLKETKQRFSDILAEGTFEVSGPLEAEADEPDLADLPRLVFTFNRRSHGRLRQLIDYINVAGVSPGSS